MVKESNIRVLIVDDDPVSSGLMAEVLKPEGYSICCRSSGANLLHELATCLPDVLLLDVLMPGMNGFEICQQIRLDKHWQHLPIILVTSLQSNQELVAGLDAGADEFISKPVNPAELRARVRSMYRVKQRADLLRQMSQMQEDLAHMVVHDLRTPLSICMMRTDMLLKFAEMDQTQKAQLIERKPQYSQKYILNIIKDQLENLKTQIDEILLVAKNGQGEIKLDLETIDLPEIINRVVEDFQAQAQREGITLQLELHPYVGENQLLDANLITRLLVNLVSNAMKFSPAQTTITVRLYADDNGRLPMMEVVDEGPGIPVKDRERIFDRYAAASLKSKNVRSIGLGLAFCKMVAEAHGGTITIHDNNPQGSVFRVQLGRL